MTIQGVFLLTVCIWFLNLFPLTGNSIASKSLSTNSDLRSSYQLEENTEDKREAMLDLAAKLQTTESTLQPTISATAPPCNCRKYCPAANSTELEKLVWIENNPILCKKTGQLDIEENTYLAFCFFDCCRKCNLQYHNCGLNPANNHAHCLRQAYGCASKCLTESSTSISIEGW